MSDLRPLLLVEDNPMDLELTLAALAKCQLANEIVVARDGMAVPSGVIDCDIPFIGGLLPSGLPPVERSGVISPSAAPPGLAGGRSPSALPAPPDAASGSGGARQCLLLLFGAANRDPRRYTDPDTFNIHRDNISHITFGKGVHYCLGANLARLEGGVALDEILNRWPEWDIDYDTAQLSPTSTVRGWERLRVVLP